MQTGLTGLLRRVRSMWVDGVLGELVPGGVALQMDTVAQRQTVDVGGETPPILQETRSGVVDVFDDAGRGLLILGDSGSGKTVSLLDLAKSLVERAEDDPHEAVPVVFNLSSWETDSSSLSEWLVDELKELYKVPSGTGRSWLAKQRLTLLLDGLDEVDPAAQSECVEAINAMIRSGLPGIAVCCRTQVYQAIPSTINLNRAFELQPLSEEQILEFVSSGGRDYTTLRNALASDAQLLEIARTPLMLRVMMSAYRGLSQNDLIRDDLTSTHRHRERLFETFLQRSFLEFESDGEKENDGGRSRFTEETVISGLSWLARRMQEHRKTVFLVERLQPSWLSKPNLQVLYLAASRLLGGIVLGLMLGVVVAVGLVLVGGGFIPSVGEIAATIVFGLMNGAVGGVAAGILDAFRVWRSQRGLRDDATAGLTARKSLILYLLVYGALGGGLFMVISSTGLVVYGIALGLIWGLLFWTFFGGTTRDIVRDDVRMVETLRFSREAAHRNGLRGLAAGFGLGIVIELIVGLTGSLDPVTRIIAAVLAGLVGAVVGAAVGSAAGGLQRGFVRSRVRPNEGMVLTAHNTLVGGGTVAIVSTAILSPLMALIIGSWWGAALGLSGGIFAGLVAAMWFGGMEILRHYLLRVLLYATGESPNPLVQFLEHAVALSLLQRVGGGYVFLHRLLFSHFVEIEDGSHRNLP